MDRLGLVVGSGIFFLKTPHAVAQSLAQVAEGARSGGRDPSALDCVVQLPVALNGGEGDAGLKRFVVSYALVDVYSRSLADQGFEREVSAIRACWEAGDRAEAVEQVSEDMVRRLIAVGDAANARRQIDAYREAGTTTPLLLPIPAAGSESEGADRLLRTVRSFSRK